MGLVESGVLAKLQAKLPNQIGSNARWETSIVTSLIQAADRAVRERIEVSQDTAVISFTDDKVEYDVPTNFITINKVEFSLDGTNYDWLLQPRSLSDLDTISYSWRTDRSARPDFYSLLSAPGVLADASANVPSKIVIYPTLQTAGSATLRITGVVIPAVGGSVAAYAPEDVQNKCHVPFVLACLYAVQEPTLAFEYYEKFKLGCDEMRNRFKSQYKDYPART